MSSQESLVRNARQCLQSGHSSNMGSCGDSRTPLQSLSGTFIYLLAFDLLSLQQHPGLPGSFLRKGRLVRKVEVGGVVVSVDRKESHLLFKLDDGTGCVPCILWTNHNKSAYFSHLTEAERGLQAGTVATQVNQVQLGHFLRVQGRISCFRSQLQVTVLSLVEEKDPNAEVLQWMQCIRLAFRCYDLPISPT